MAPMTDIPIVKAALAYDIPDTGEVIILIINQALYFGDSLSHVLLNPNQMRSYNIKVDDIPRHLSKDSAHSIIIEEENLSIPLKLHGIISYFNARTPAIHEIENCQHVTLTPANEWNPYSSHFAEEELKTINNMNLSILAIEYMDQADRLLLNVIEDERISVAVKLDKKESIYSRTEISKQLGHWPH
jgi:hypothetical protein